MSDSLVPPPAGWYPAPNGSGEQWWWDGAAWTQPQPPAQPVPPAQPQQPAQPVQPAQPLPPVQPAQPAQPEQTAQPAQAPQYQQYQQEQYQQYQAQPQYQSYQQPQYQQFQPQPRNTESIARLSKAVQVLLWVGAGFSLITIFIEIYGLAVTTEFMNDPFLPMDRVMNYASISSVAGIFASLVLIATGICWVIWQFQVAKQVIGMTRRTPGWHIGSWFIPIVSFWFPYQNISDLWKAVGRPQPSWLIGWWLLWLVSGVTSQVSARILLDSYEVEGWRAAMGWGIGAEILSIAAVPLACMIVRGITDGVRNLPAYVTPVVAR